MELRAEDSLEPQEIQGLEELEVDENLFGTDISYGVTVRLAVSVQLTSLFPKAAIEDAITALETVIGLAFELPHSSIDATEILESYAEKIEKL